jgi:hypothetical protein
VEVGDVEVVVVGDGVRIGGEQVKHLGDRLALVVPPGRAERQDGGVRVAGLDRAVRDLLELDVILDRAVPGVPLAVRDVDLVPDDPGVDLAAIVGRHLPHELAPVVVGVVIRQVEVLGDAVAGAVGGGPARHVQDGAGELSAATCLLVDEAVLVRREQIEVARAALLHLAPPEEEPRPAGTGLVGAVADPPGLVEAEARVAGDGSVGGGRLGGHEQRRGRNQRDQ